MFYNSKKLKIVEKKEFHFPSSPHIAQAIRFQIIGSNTTFWVVNAHVNYTTRASDLPLLLGFVQKLGDVPVFIMGDFNAEPKEDWYTQFKNSAITDFFYGTVDAKMFYFSRRKFRLCKSYIQCQPNKQ
jgi:endonuclease/exonuclease/phosphatase family metal-dependent hydrolase